LDREPAVSHGWLLVGAGQQRSIQPLVPPATEKAG